MTLQTIRTPPVEAHPGATGVDTAATRRPTAGRGWHTGQIVATEVAAAVAVAGTTHGAPGAVAGVGAAAGLLAATWLRPRGRWAYRWAGTALRFAGRRRALAAGAGAAELLDLLRPGTRVLTADVAGHSAGVLLDGHGMTAVLDLGDGAGLLAEALPALPPLTALLPTAGGPATSVQVLLTGAPAPALRAGAGTPATSYRQLTEGRVPAGLRAVVAVRVLRPEGCGSPELLRALSGTLRRLVRRLGAVPGRPLPAAALLDVLAELAGLDANTPAREEWHGWRLGAGPQATYRLRCPPGLPADAARRLIDRTLALPTTGTTVALALGPLGDEGTGTPVRLTVRLAAATGPQLAAAAGALRELAAAHGVLAAPMDGEQHAGLAATLPLGGARTGAVPGRRRPGGTVPDGLAGLALEVGAAGLMLGRNRHDEPVVVRMFRPEQTRAMLVGGIGAAQLVTLRAMGLGARVVVQTSRPAAWEPFVRGASVPGEAITVAPPGRALDLAAGTAAHPLLVVVDVGPVGADTAPGRGWEATLVVRDDFAAVDVAAAGRADLLILQPLQAHEAAAVGAVLGLGEAADWLTRIRQDMVAVVNRRSVRWARLAPTDIETHLIGPPVRR